MTSGSAPNTTRSAAAPTSIRVGQEFFRRALDRKVIVVPGAFFDVDPGSRRRARLSRFRSHVRFSFGPSYDVLERGLERLADLVREAENESD